MRLRSPSPRTAAIAIGAGRVGLGTGFLLLPEQSTRMLGLDAVTARRISWLARMTAARDIALGAGTVTSAVSRHDPSWWLLGGAISDAVDAVALAGAVRAKRLPVTRAGAMVFLAAAAAAAGAVVADRSR
jgi:hypothetical protein